MEYKKYSFTDDYSEGCHQSILDLLNATNKIQQTGYSNDEYSIKAKDLICKDMGSETADVYFVSGGTQANLIVISALLRPHEAVIAANTGHIYTNEAGAIEAVGHKVISVETKDGKLNPTLIEIVISDYHHAPHVVKPRMVYISNTTEIGTIYSGLELKEIYEFCKLNELLLFVDGARLGSALTSEYTDLAMSDMAKYSDVFYIGGTKGGALIGEAIVINNDELKRDFDFNLKQKGAFLSKGRTIGIQFLGLFTDKLYYNLAENANKMADKIAKALQRVSVEFFVEPMSNQIFPILTDEQIEKLHQKYEFHIWKQLDNNRSAFRLICSWATPESAVDEFIIDVLDLI